MKKCRLTVLLPVLCLLVLIPLSAQAKGVILNFNEVDISTIVKFISDLTGKNFVMDDRVKGKISIFSPAKLSPEESFNVFTSVLELKGFTLLQTGKVYKIIPTAIAKQSGVAMVADKDRGPVNESYVAQVIPLERISSQEAVPFLQPIVSKDGYIASFGPANMILVVDASLNIQKILGILQVIDSDPRREKPELVFLKTAGSENLANVIREWLKSRDKTVKTGPTPTIMLGNIVADSRLNALILFGSDKDKEDIKRLIALLDIVPPLSSSKINVHYLEHADATEVAKVMEGMLKPSMSASSPVTTTPGSPVTSLSPTSSPFEGSKISITPDKATNSLVILASPTDYQNLLLVIQRLDKRRRQVFVQAVIAEVSLDKLMDIGAQLTLGGGGAGGTTGFAGMLDPFGFMGATPTVQQAAIATILRGFISQSNVQIGGVLKALQSNGIVNVLSTPTIMTSDNKEAEIFVGENVPFLTQTNITSGGISQQSVERKDTGIILKITPQISEGEYVKLDIYQEISAVKDSQGQAKDLVTTKRSAKTSVVVKDQDSVIIGGLIQDRDTETISKVPGLGDIPLLGWMFKTKTMQRHKTNLLILLRPHIIRGAQEMADITKKQDQEFKDSVRQDRPLTPEKEPPAKP